MEPGMPPPMREDRPAVPRPQSVFGWPRYLCRLLGGFFSRLFYILSLLWETRKSALFLLSFFCILDGVLPVAGAFISAELLQALGNTLGGDSGESFRYILYLLIALFSYQFLRRVLGRTSAMLTRITGELVTNHIRVKIMNKARTVDIGSFDRPEFYEKLENANREASMRPVQILSATFDIISASVSMVSFIVILTALSPVAPLLILLMALPGAIINYVYRRKTFQYMRKRSKDRRQMDYYAGVMVNKDLAKEVRLLDLSDTFIEKYKTVFGHYYRGIRRLIVQEGAWHIAVSLVTVLCNAILFAYVAYGVYEGRLNLGDYSLYTGALNSIITYVGTLVTATATVYEGTLFIDNMMTFMEEPVAIRPTVAPPVQPARGVPHTIEFRHVGFSYPGADRPVLKDINLRLQSGETTVLVGLNGAGKTTLIKLLTRLYDPTEGVILLDGRDLREYDVRALYDLFGIVFQDFGKYAVNVRENITFGDVHRAPEEARVRDAAAESAAADFINHLPSGYDTPLMRYFEENGTELSIGQWQKLSVARAFYKDSDILILDEPTASLDPMAEQDVFRQFSRLAQHKITVFVSHRLSSATTADQILVLENGRVAECGTHADLMHLHGRYYELFTTQAERYISGEEAE